MEKILVAENESQLADIVEKVCRTHEPVTVAKPSGEEVRVIPVPKPIGYRKGVPIYRTEDLQFLAHEYPFFFD